MNFERYFDGQTMSLHLKENTPPLAKKGVPGLWELIQVDSEVVTHEDIQGYAREIIQCAHDRQDGFLEGQRVGSTIAQIGLFRIVITQPPFSESCEITIVRPVKRLRFDDYELNPILKERLAGQAEGMLIAGSPGMGKTTFAQALAEYYSEKKKIVKTVEAPRDLVLPESVTQYSLSHGDAQEIHDILLLTRPDYTFFDEMRNTDDFKLYADMRLAGVGMVGVVHATNPVDAIQRFVGRIELGMIPQIIDTVIFIKNGMVAKVLNLSMTIKVPSGMQEADLARPVVVVYDYETNELMYELYTFGEETVVMPVSTLTGASPITPSQKLATQYIQDIFKVYTHKPYKVEMSSDFKCTVYVDAQEIPKLIGRQGKRIAEIEEHLGISLDIRKLKDSPKSPGREEDIEIDDGIPYNFQKLKGGARLILERPSPTSGERALQGRSNGDAREFDIFVDGDHIYTTFSDRSFVIELDRKHKIERRIIQAIQRGHHVAVR